MIDEKVSLNQTLDKNTIVPESMENKEVTVPQLKNEDPFATQRRLQFGPLKISKEGITIDNGTQVSMKLTANGIFAYGTAEDTFNFRSSETSAIYGNIGFRSADSAFYIASKNDNNLYLYSSDSGGNLLSWMALTNDGNAYLTGTGNGAEVFITSDDDSASTVKIKGGATGTATNTGFYVYSNTGGGYVEKSAIVETSEGYNALYCTESPEVWFMDFCYGVKKRKWYAPWIWHWELRPDRMFIEVTEKPYVVMKTEQKNTVQIWAKRKGLAHKRFEAKTRKEFDENNKFWSTPKRKAKEKYGINS